MFSLSPGPPTVHSFAPRGSRERWGGALAPFQHGFDGGGALLCSGQPFPRWAAWGLLPCSGGERLYSGKARSAKLVPGFVITAPTHSCLLMMRSRSL